MNSRDRFLNACRRVQVDRPPVWLMRQAGRYLPEYQEIRKKYDFLTMCRQPELIFEVSLQPWHRFEMDAVIVFTDILLPLHAMGPKLAFEQSEGPKFDTAIRTKKDVSQLVVPNARLSFGYLFEALENLHYELKDDAALLGFVGAPWTLAVYLIEGGSGAFRTAMNLLREDPETVHALMEKITELTISLAVEQVRSGADVIQIFDTWGGLLNNSEYRENALPYLKEIVKETQKTGAPVIIFIKQSADLLNEMAASGADVLSIGFDVPMQNALEIFGNRIAVQGNLDPEILFHPPAIVERETQKMLDAVQNHTGYIANLGHGVMPGTSVECVRAFVDTVKKHSGSSTI